MQRQISPLRIDQMVSDLLAWRVWLERTYSLSAVLVTGAGPRRLTIYTPGCPQTPTPSRTSVVLWLFGRRAEPSHNPKGTSFKTRLFPALHVPSLESLGHMPSDVITAQQLSWDSLPLWLSSLSSPWTFFSSTLWLPSSLARGSAAFPGSLGIGVWRSHESGGFSGGSLFNRPCLLSIWGAVLSLGLVSLHSFIPLPPHSLSSNSLSPWHCCSFPQLL